MSQQRSKHYDWFNAPGKNNGSGKFVFPWKRVLSVLKVFLYVFLLGISLAGCAQTFVIKSDKKTGSGLEFYRSRENIAPRVVTLQQLPDNKYKTKMNFISLTGENYWLRDPATLKGVHKENPDLGNWKSKTESLRIENPKGVSVFGAQHPLVAENQTGGVSSKFLVVNDQDKRNYQYKSDQTSPFLSKIPSLYVTNKGSILDLLKDGAKWTDKFRIIDTKFSAIAPDITKWRDASDKGQGSAHEMAFALDTYIYLGEHYLNLNIGTPDAPQYQPAIKVGQPVTSEDKVWLLNYVNVAGVTGWNARTVNKKGAFNYAGGTLAFSTMEPQRAIYSWSTSWRLGPFYALFVYPISLLTNQVLGGVGQHSGWEAIIAILVVVLVVRSLAYLFGFKSTLQMLKQQEIQSKVAIINAKYEPYKSNKQMMRRKQQETMELYKKEGVSMFGAFSQIFLTMPLFISMWRVIGSNPSLKSTIWLGINFSATSYQELFKGEFQYLALMVVTAVVQGLQLLTPRLFTKRREKKRTNVYQRQALKKSNRTQNIMLVVFVGISLILTAGLEVYWFFTGLFTIGQNVINHYIIKHQHKRRKRQSAY